MRILIASKRRPDTPGRRNGGVQTWVSTVAAELHKRGYGVEVADRYNVLTQTFDVGIFANSSYTAPLANLCKRSILVTHGIVPDEAPGESFGKVMYTSEEVRDHWEPGRVGGIIRQPIDLNFWKPRPVKRKFLLRVAGRSGLPMLFDVASALETPFRHLRNFDPEEARRVIRQSVCVLASGRAAVEAMACGIPVVICDARHYQGPLMDLDILGSMGRNYSGRGGVKPTHENVEAAVVRAIAKGSLRSHVEQHHDVVDIVDQLLRTAA